MFLLLERKFQDVGIYMLKVRIHNYNSLRVVSILLLLGDHGVFLYLSTAVYL